MRDSTSYRVFRVLNVVALLLIVFVTLYPFANMVAQSFSSEGNINAGRVNLIPVGFNLETYKVVMADSMFWTNYKNTAIYTVVATAISIVLTTAFAYAISKRRLKGRNLFIGIAVFTMFFAGGIIPNYVLVTSLGLKNSLWAIVLPNAISVFNLLIMKSFFEGMPVELEEAAAIDGMNTYGILLHIVLPLSKAVLATMILFYAVINWNAWFGAFLYLDNKEMFPLTIFLRNMIAGASTATSAGGGADNLAQVASNIKSVAMVLSVVPILVIYPFVQKYFVTGVMLGSVKG